jgi:hypothetical protein
VPETSTADDRFDELPAVGGALLLNLISRRTREHRWPDICHIQGEGFDGSTDGGSGQT